MKKSNLALLLAVSALALSACASVPEAPQDASSSQVSAVAQDPMLAGFRDPPNAARPRTWWHWMNGNITQEGIARDLDWMHRIGLSGFQNFDANLQTPQIVDERLIYMTPEWREAFRFATAEAARLDLEMAIAASPGWSETGGPWVAPEDGMKKLVWGETLLRGGESFIGQINPAPTATGSFQALHFQDDAVSSLGVVDEKPVPTSSDRIAVLAVPVSNTTLAQPSFALGDGSAVDAAPLIDADLESSIALPLTTDLSGALHVNYPEPVTIRTLHLSMPGLVRPFREPPIMPVLEMRVEGVWQEVARLPLTTIPTTYSFEPVTAAEFRLRVEKNSEAVAPTEMGGVPGAIVVDIFALGDLSTVPVANLRLSGEHRINRAEEKAGYGSVLDYYAIMSGDEAAVSLSANDMIDLTDRIDAQGNLDWTPPAGTNWRVLDFGWSLTGKTNHPAPPEATGLEVDKLDPAAVRRYVETYLGMYRETVGDDLIGERGLRALLTDSIEVGFANWTPQMEQEFAARRGYALRPWLPALTGMVIGSEAETEAFLYDYRQTLSEMVTDHHYGTVAEVAHENGLIVYGEALEDKRPLLGDDLSMRRHADVPMAALWTFSRGGQVRTTMLGDMKGAASTAHVFGQKYVAAESMTSSLSPWAFSPRELKRIIDLEFAYGINRPVIHTSVHVPVEDRKPGLSLLIFGQYFNRNETWAEMARPWVDYMARSSYMLQQGEYYADIAWFRGEEAPITAQFATSVPEGLPTLYGYDFINADMLTDAFRVEDGMLVSQGGTKYRILFLGPNAQRMTMPTLERLAKLVDQGATVAGRKPVSSPSLADDAAAFAALADRLWAHERVIESDDPEATLAQMGVAADFSFTSDTPDAEVIFLHRKSNDADIYFINNRQNRAENIEARFRVSGRAPEMWDAISGTSRPLSFRTEGDVTIVPLALGHEDAKFIVFREPTSVASRTIAEISTREIGRIEGPWSVSFEEGRGAPSGIELGALVPLNEHAEEGVRYFSGVATYSTSFSLPATAQAHAQAHGEAGQPLWLDLGQVADVAEVFVNGEAAGITWFAPDRLDISQFVRPGINSLEVRVANRWVNRLIGDVQEGVEPVTFTAAPTYRPDASLLPSGLIGPVKIFIND